MAVCLIGCQKIIRYLPALFQSDHRSTNALGPPALAQEEVSVSGKSIRSEQGGDPLSCPIEVLSSVPFKFTRNTVHWGRTSASKEPDITSSSRVVSMRVFFRCSSFSPTQ